MQEMLTKAPTQVQRLAHAQHSVFARQPARSIIQFQQGFSNNAARALLPYPDVHAKLAINEPGDIYEEEADRVANEVVSFRDAGTGGRGREHFQAVDSMPVARHQTTAVKVPSAAAQRPGGSFLEELGSSQSLDRSVRGSMEYHFGHDFGSVRVHTDARAANSAQGVNAFAYTIGSDIVFAHGQYSPTTRDGQRLLAHELTHVVQQRAGRAPMATLQRAPQDLIEVTLIEVSRSESDLLYQNYGIRLPGSPPSPLFGNDGPIPLTNRKSVQSAFDLAYWTAASPSFATRLGEFKKGLGKQGEINLPGLANLSQQKYLAALSSMKIHLAETSKNALVKKFVQEESQSGEKLPTAGFTPIGGSDVFVRAFALMEGRDALAALILHEAVHVAGLPARPINEFLETIMEGAIHGFEASVGLPLSQIVERAAVIGNVKPHNQGVEFQVSVAKPDNLPSDTVRTEVLDGNRRMVFLQEQPKAKFTKKYVWNGFDARGHPTESGIHSIRVVAGNVLIAASDYVLRRDKK